MNFRTRTHVLGFTLGAWTGLFLAGTSSTFLPKASADTTALNSIDLLMKKLHIGSENKAPRELNPAEQIDVELRKPENIPAACAKDTKAYFRGIAAFFEGKQFSSFPPPDLITEWANYPKEKHGALEKLPPDERLPISGIDNENLACELDSKGTSTAKKTMGSHQARQCCKEGFQTAAERMLERLRQDPLLLSGNDNEKKLFEEISLLLGARARSAENQKDDACHALAVEDEKGAEECPLLQSEFANREARRFIEFRKSSQGADLKSSAEYLARRLLFIEYLAHVQRCPGKADLSSRQPGVTNKQSKTGVPNGGPALGPAPENTGSRAE